MADREIVIKISEENYELAQRFCKGTIILDDFLKPKVGRIIITRLMKAIGKGTPLEKHDEEVIKETVESIWGKPPYNDVLDKIRAEILEEKEGAYADFERYKVEYLGQDWEDAYDSLPQDDFRYGMERCIEIIDKYRKGDKE